VTVIGLFRVRCLTIGFLSAGIMSGF